MRNNEGTAALHVSFDFELTVFAPPATLFVDLSSARGSMWIMDSGSAFHRCSMEGMPTRVNLCDPGYRPSAPQIILSWY